MNTIFLIGYMGCGKTTIGQLLANHLHWQLIDTDYIIEQQQQTTCSNIIAERGEQAFRKLEHQCLLTLAQQDLSNTIISTGGGMPCFNNNILTMKQCGHVIYIKWSATDLATRLLLTDLSKRPLIQHLDKQQLIELISTQLSQREKTYLQADEIIKAPINHLSVLNDQEIADQIIMTHNLTNE